MKKKWMTICSSAVVATFLITGCSSNEAKPAAGDAAASAPAAGENVINIEASNWKFNQETFEAKVGQPVTINFKTTEGVHGITIDGLGVDISREGSETITPEKAGEYQILCSIPCGPDHGKMIAKLVVK